MEWEPVAGAAADPSTSVPLAYSLPAFGASGYDRAEEWLDQLRELGFHWVVLHPTYAVQPDLTIDAPAVLSIGAVMAHARSLGMQVRLEPHLDWWPTLHGGPYEWRKSMLIDPAGDYWDQVLAPAADLEPDELTLGSELDLSVYRFVDSWSGVAERLGGGARLGHKVNHDVFASEWRPDRKWRLRRYLDGLDYKAMSFYMPGEWRIDPGWTIGEFGLGSTDVDRPWHFDAATFATEDAWEVRREWYLQFLDWLPSSGSTGAAAFWTAGHFDVLGVMDPGWGDVKIVEAVRGYLKATT